MKTKVGRKSSISDDFKPKILVNFPLETNPQSNQPTTSQASRITRKRLKHDESDDLGSLGPLEYIATPVLGQASLPKNSKLFKPKDSGTSSPSTDSTKTIMDIESYDNVYCEQPLDLEQVLNMTNNLSTIQDLQFISSLNQTTQLNMMESLIQRQTMLLKEFTEDDLGISIPSLNGFDQGINLAAISPPKDPWDVLTNNFVPMDTNFEIFPTFDFNQDFNQHEKEINQDINDVKTESSKDKPRKVKRVKSEEISQTDCSDTESYQRKRSSSLSSTGSCKKKGVFVCDECGKKFSVGGYLARHKRVHSGERPHACPIPDCDARFGRHDNLLQHWRAHVKRLDNLEGIPLPPPLKPVKK